MTEPTQTTTTRIPESLAQRLDAYADARGLKRATAIREVIATGLDEQAEAERLATMEKRIREFLDDRLGYLVNTLEKRLKRTT